MVLLTRLFRIRRCVELLAAIALFTLFNLSARYSLAADSFWTNPAGGAFHDVVNWSSGVPLPSSEAHFDLDSNFSVTFPRPAVNEKLVFRRGDVTFDLGGLTYTMTSDIIVSDPTGRLAVLSATRGLLRSNTLHVGLQAGESGVFRLSAEARYEGAGGASVGLGGTGEIIVEKGALATGTSLAIGTLATGSGKLSVQGAGSQWRSAGNLVVGDEGSGELLIADGGIVEAGDDFILGGSPSSNGEVNVRGNGAILRSDELAIALQGSAQVAVTGGGIIETALTTLAENGGSVANVTLGGAGTALLTRSIFVGGNATAPGGSATLSVTDAAELSVGLDEVDDLKIWNQGRLIVDGGSVRAANLTRLGSLDFKSGLIQIVGGRLESAGPFVLNSDDPAATSQLHLRDGARTAGFTRLTVGQNRSGSLAVSNGALVTAEDMVVAALPGSTGTIAVTGAGSKLSITGSMSVGGTATDAGGAGTLTLTDRAVAEVPTGSLKVWPGGTIKLDGGTLSVASYEPRGGTFDFPSGAFEVRGGAILGNHAFLTHLLGPAHDVRAGRELRLPNLTLESDLLLNGGSLDSATLVNNSVVVASAGRLVASQFDNRSLGLMRLEGSATVVAAQLVNAGEISLSSETTTITGDQLLNTGVISGFGRVGIRLQNSAGGEVRPDADRRLTFLRPGNANNGRIEAINGASIEFRGDLTNDVAGRIVARDGTLRFPGGVTNSGNLTISGGLGELFGDILNTTAGRITVAGQSTALFYDDLVNRGTVHVSDGATAVYLGTVSGEGTFTGKGTVQFEGSFLPGRAGAATDIEGDVLFTQGSRLTMELTGNSTGDPGDSLNVGGMLALGGTLDIALSASLSPELGNAFDLFDAAEVRGEFDAVRLPDLGAGLYWDTNELYQTGAIQVVPEPAALFLSSAAFSTLFVAITIGRSARARVRNRE
jgi:T5SS/PEP-CTERM-associated repeat protein